MGPAHLEDQAGGGRIQLEEGGIPGQKDLRGVRDQEPGPGRSPTHEPQGKQSLSPTVLRVLEDTEPGKVATLLEPASQHGRAGRDQTGREGDRLGDL